LYLKDCISERLKLPKIDLWVKHEDESHFHLIQPQEGIMLMQGVCKENLDLPQSSCEAQG
jgi:hypothetical protein